MARDCNGSTDLITCSTAIQLRYPMTVAAWFNIDVMPGAGTGDGIVGSGGGTYQFGATGTNSWITTGTWYWAGVIITSSNVRFFRKAAGSAIAFANVGHVQTDNNGWRFYVHNDSSSLGFNWETAAGSNTLIGDYPALNNFDGRLARVCVWDAQLTDAEVEGSRLALPARPHLLLGWWELFGVSSPEPDWAAGNNGTLTGTSRIDHPPEIGFLIGRPRRIWKIPTAADLGARNLTITHYT